MLRHDPPGVNFRLAPAMRRTAMTIAATFVLLLVGCSRTPAVESGSGSSSNADPCAWAGTLVREGFPQRAIARIEEVASEGSSDAAKVCPDQRSAANRAIDEAVALASRAKDLAPSQNAVELARRALGKDHDNVVAASILSPANLTCLNAADLLVGGFPQRAIALIAAANSQLAAGAAKICPQIHSAAATAMEEAQGQALTGKALEQTSLPEAKAIASQALQKDRENAVAQEIAAIPDPSSWQVYLKQWDDFTKGTLTPASGLLVPAAWLAVGLVLIARLLVLVPFRSFGRSRAWAAEVRVFLGLVAILVGSAAVVSLISTSEASMLALAETQAWSWAWAAAGVCGLGVILLAWGLATRLRIGVTARKGSNADDVGAAHVLALLDDLGAAPPRGLEKPQGADVTALGNALDSVAEHPVGKALKAILAAVTGWLPWQVRVDEETEGAVSVAVSRNGYTMGSAVIDLAAMGVAPAKDASTSVAKTETASASDSKEPKVDLHRFVAAFVLTTLEKHHRGFEGLCGATDWRSLGLHYVATTDLKTDENKAREWLSKAVDLDGNNWLAQVALASARWRKATNPEVLARYVTWLNGAIAQMTRGQRTEPASTRAPSLGRAKPGFEHLRLRARVSLTTASINRGFLVAPNGNELNEARKAMVAQCIDLALARKMERRDAWLVMSRARAAATAQLWHGTPAGEPVLDRGGQVVLDRRGQVEIRPLTYTIPRDIAYIPLLFHVANPLAAVAEHQKDISEKRIANRIHYDVANWGDLPRGPHVHYSLGCAIASRPDPDPDYDEAVAELSQAKDDPELADWIHRDPQLKKFTATDQYRLNFAPSARTELLELPPFKPMRKALEVLGMTRPCDWARLDYSERAQLARSIPTNLRQVRALADLATIALSLGAHAYLRAPALEILAQLIAEGLTSIDLIRQRVETGNLDSLAEGIMDATEKFVPAEDRAAMATALDIWLQSL